MVSLSLYPRGSLECDEKSIIISTTLNSTNIMYDDIFNIKFIKPGRISNGRIIFELFNEKSKTCIFKKKRLTDAQMIYKEILRFKNQQNNSQESEKKLHYTCTQESYSNKNGKDIEVNGNKDFKNNNISLKFCPECGTDVLPNSKYCMNCGTYLLIHQNTSENSEEVNNIQNNELKELIDREYEEACKMYIEGYYFTEEAKINGKQIYEDKKQYLLNHPTDFDVKGASIIGSYWYALDELPPEKRKIYTLTGKGKYFEEQGDFEEAIKIYQEGIDLTLNVCSKEIKELTEEYGEGDWLYCGKIMPRIRVCRNKLFREKTKKMEEEAKQLEKSNPQRAIEIYNELNELKPGLKKYNKRIKICKKRL